MALGEHHSGAAGTLGSRDIHPLCLVDGHAAHGRKTSLRSARGSGLAVGGHRVLGGLRSYGRQVDAPFAGRSLGNSSDFMKRSKSKRGRTVYC